MANPQLVVNIIGNTKALIDNLNAGRHAIEAYGPTVATMRDTWARHSAVIIEKAALVTAGMKGISASTLTARDAAANLKTLEAGMAQLKNAGQPIPALMQSTAAELRKVGDAATQTIVPTQTLAQRMDGLKSGLTSFAAGARTVGFGLTAAITAPILAVGAAAIKLGMDAVESENLVTVSFGNMKGAADEWAAGLSKSLGLNKFETEKMAGTLFNMTTSMGLTRKAAFEMSTGVVQLSADMASFRNIPMQEALDKITSGLTGEAEPLKRIGILVNEATVKTYAYTHGIAAQGATLTEQEKIMARYGSILAQTANDQGDLARTLESPTNQLRLMRSRIEEATTALGVALIPMVQNVIGVISSLVPYIQSAVQLFTNLPAPVQLAAVGLLGIAAAVGPLLLLLGAMASAWASLIPLYVSVAGGSTAVAAGLGTVGASSAVAATGVGILSTAMGFLYTTMLPIAATAAAIYAALKVGQTQKVSEAFEYLGLRLQGHSSELAHLTINSRNALAAMGDHTKTIVAQAAVVVSQATPAVEDYATQLAKAKAEVAALTPETRKQIDAALKLGATADEITKKIGLSEGALKFYQAGLTAATAASTKTAAATKALAAEQQKFIELADAASVKGWAAELERVAKLAQLDRQALFEMNLELERQISDVNALALAHKDAAANLFLQEELDLYRLQTDALTAQQKVISEINNENGLRQMAKDAGVEVDKLIPKVASIGGTFSIVKAGAMDALGSLPGIFQRAFEGGGGLIGAMKSWGIQLATNMITPMLQGLSAVKQQAVGIGGSIAAALGGSVGGGMGSQIAGLAAGFGGAAIAATGWGTSMAAAGVMGTVALGAATLGIGAAAVGVYALAKHFTGLSAEEKAGRAAADEFRVSLAGLLTDAQRLEAQTIVAQGANAAWAVTAISVRDAYLAAGLSAEEALAAVDRLWKAEQQGGDAVARVIEEIRSKMTALTPPTRAAGDAFDRAATQGVIGFQQVQDTIRRLTTDAILSGNNSLIMAMLTLEEQMQIAAESGVQDFAFMTTQIQHMKDLIAQGINIPLTLGPMPNVPGAPGGDVGGVGASGGGGSVGATIRDFLARNPGDNARISSALGIDQATVSNLGFRSGTPNLDYMSFPSGGGIFPLHNTEAVIPKGSGHQLAAEIAAAMPARGAVHDAKLYEMLERREQALERRERALPHLMSRMIADALATTARR